MSMILDAIKRSKEAPEAGGSVPVSRALKRAQNWQDAR